MSGGLRPVDLRKEFPFYTWPTHRTVVGAGPGVGAGPVEYTVTEKEVKRGGFSGSRGVLKEAASL